MKREKETKMGIRRLEPFSILYIVCVLLSSAVNILVCGILRRSMIFRTYDTNQSTAHSMVLFLNYSIQFNSV